ncbi:uncharacterized protein (DUF1015 family) [Propionicimonas paludicola]|uniref:Uncharacterized protein (DUF1015 family) n=1 Tax=Propionicimonas paludicola TaxID=185243 RepID=A0A2A9CMK1_9ACTN|nr:DUF1015 domain-containing protein [Propionicimonas paludicola]PFG15634.1 uncharacterized protein (DUF1015 family) [Propionicimonas paludicola]
MPKIAPFAALRYAAGTDLQLVIAPPYDVLSAADVAELGALDEHNIVHVDVPTGGDDRYQVAARTLDEWLASGVLVRDDTPSLTIYRMSFTDATGTDRTIVGVLAGLEVVDLDAGGVLPHERTTPKAVTDRLDLTRATATNLSPVWGLSLASGLTAALAAPGEPVGSMTADGVLHSVERITDPARIAEITAIIGADDVLIADGHHRYSISRSYRDEVRAASGRTDTEAEFTLTFINELVADQLSIEAIHRTYTNICVDELRANLSGCFDIELAPAPTPAMLAQMVELGRLVLIGPDTTEWLIPKPGVFDDVRALDGAYLEHALTDSRAEVSYQHGLDEVVELVASGQVNAAILIRPTSLAEIQRTAREGLLMPPKSTFFTPKLRTGLVIRPTAAL